MDIVQVAIRDKAYAAALRDLLQRSGAGEVRFVEAPDPASEGVIVVDPEALERMPQPLVRPERVVLITRNDPEQLSRAWHAGIRSVVFCNDPLNTAVLAILAAGLRRPAARPRSGCTGGASQAKPAGAGHPAAEPDGGGSRINEHRG